MRGLSAAAALLATSALAGETATWPVEVGAMADSAGFVPGIPHPLFSVGTELPLGDEGAARIVQMVQLDYRVQPQFLHGPGVNTRLVARLMSGLGLYGELGLGLGYVMAFLGPQTWVVDPVSGDYTKAGSQPRSLFKLILALGVGLDFSVKWKLPLRVVAAYDEAILFNAAPKGGWPIVPSPAFGVRVAWLLGGAP